MIFVIADDEATTCGAATTALRVPCLMPQPSAIQRSNTCDLDEATTDTAVAVALCFMADGTVLCGTT
jgi:hypothetical protein